MSGIYYGLFVVAILAVIRWSMKNDTLDGTSGFFAMRDRAKKVEDASVRKKFRPSLGDRDAKQ